MRKNSYRFTLAFCFALALAAVWMFRFPSSPAFQIMDSDPENKASRNPDYPDFGSGAANIRHYNIDASTITPSQVITETSQTLSEISLGKAVKADIGVTAIGDGEFAFIIDGTQQESAFYACYDGFAVYALDLDGAGVDRILVEHGRGRGTCVYERSLSIYAYDGNRLTLTHKIKLSEWHMDDELHRPVAWAKGYAIIRDKNGKIVIRLSPLGV